MSDFLKKKNFASAIKPPRPQASGVSQPLTMSDTPSSVLAAQRGLLDALTSQYQANFAGQSRATRDAALMASMRDGAAYLVEVVTGLPSGVERDALLADALRARDLYVQEAAAILEAQRQAQDPDFAEARRLSQWARLTARRYLRHFAGQSRLTRDAGLLAELIGDLERLSEDVAALAQTFASPELEETRAQVENNLRLYRTERDEIHAAREQQTPDQRTDMLAQLANAQFQVYADHFAGKSRSSRRPVLLERVIDNLQQARAQMLALNLSNADLPNNAKNAEIVQGRLDFYQSELIEIRKSRESAQFQDLVGALGGAANQVFDEYKQHFAGHDRKTRELARLSKLCDQLYEVAHQMDDLDRVKENATNVANLNIVLDNLNMYENEFDEITKVQRGA